MRLDKYRADIDGLRAISALAIFAYHLGFEAISGGFVGVDIFFVISGYLIVPRIVAGLENNSFSLREFFVKRIRRILPALFLVIAFSFVVGFFVLGPREYKEFAQSALSTIGFAANFFFHDRSDYFADVSHQKPLLHAWSLGVEEQFYIVIPLVLLGLWKVGKISPRKLVIFITLASLIFNLVMVRIDEPKAFYFPMSRFWELGIGGLIALYLGDLKTSKIVNLILTCAGILLLVISLIVIDDGVLYPGELALLPVLSAAFLLFAGQNHPNIFSNILGSGLFRYFGRISYSLYLIHWPVIVFARLYLSRPFTLTEQLLIFIFGVIWAAGSWHFIEKKMLNKNKVPTKSLLVGVGVTAAVLLTANWYVSATNGLPNRMSEQSIALVADMKAYNEKHVKRCDFGVSLGRGLAAKYGVCSYGNTEGNHVLFWGDSHSSMIVRSLFRLYGKEDELVSATVMPDCSPIIGVTTTRRKNRKICPIYIDEVMNFISSKQVDLVVLGGRWGNLASDYRSPGNGGKSETLFDSHNEGREISFKDAFTRTLVEIKKSGASVLIVGPVPEIEFHVPDTLIRTLNGIGKLPIVSREGFDKRQSIVLDALREFEAQGLASVIYPHEFLCDEETCTVYKDGKILYLDDDHLTIEGARPIADALRAYFAQMDLNAQKAN